MMHGMERTALVAALLFTAAAGPTNSFLTVTPLPEFPAPVTKNKPAASAPADYTAAPTPNQDAIAPTPPKGSQDASLSPGFFQRRNPTTGEGYVASSSVQSEQERRVKPGAGLSLSMPLQ